MFERYFQKLENRLRDYMPEAHFTTRGKIGDTLLEINYNGHKVSVVKMGNKLYLMDRHGNMTFCDTVGSVSSNAMKIVNQSGILFKKVV